MGISLVPEGRKLFASLSVRENLMVAATAAQGRTGDGDRRWTLDATLAKGRQHLVVRAFDETGQGQPERPDTVWNFAGYLCTAWHHVHVLVE